MLANRWRQPPGGVANVETVIGHLIEGLPRQPGASGSTGLPRRRWPDSQSVLPQRCLSQCISEGLMDGDDGVEADYFHRPTRARPISDDAELGCGCDLVVRADQ